MPAACTKPNHEASVLNDVEPSWNSTPRWAQNVSVKVFLDANGAVLSAVVLQSSGFSDVDFEALVAARASTYAPKVINCRAVPGTYVFTWGVLH
jgi:TonB family protein